MYDNSQLDCQLTVEKFALQLQIPVYLVPFQWNFMGHNGPAHSHSTFFHLSHDAEMLILISFYCQNLTSPNVQWIFHMYPLLYASSCIGTRATVQNNKSELQYCTYENTKVGSWKQLTCKSSIQKKKKKKRRRKRPVCFEKISENKRTHCFDTYWKQENAMLWYVFCLKRKMNKQKRNFLLNLF